MTIVAHLHEQAFDPAAELAQLTRSAQGDGAIVSFVGLARRADKKGQPLDRLVLDHHPLLTAESLRRIAAQAAEKFEVSHIRVAHRSGSIAPGEPIVFAGAAAAHRKAAFEAADYLMDRLKTEAVFWKREEGPGGRQWIEPTKADYSARARWDR